MVNNIVNNNPNMAASLQGTWRQKVCAAPPAPPALMTTSFALPAPLQVLYFSRVFVVTVVSNLLMSADYWLMTCTPMHVCTHCAQHPPRTPQPRIKQYPSIKQKPCMQTPLTNMHIYITYQKPACRASGAGAHRISSLLSCYSTFNQNQHLTCNTLRSGPAGKGSFWLASSPYLWREGERYWSWPCI